MTQSPELNKPRRDRIRLDWFLPFLRKKKKNAVLPELSRSESFLRRILPSVLFANRETGKPGLLRRLLLKVGPTFLSSPWRRAVQAVCFVAFLWLFFVTCWPYSASPAPPAAISTGWRFVEIDQASGHYRFVHDSGGKIVFDQRVGASVFVADASTQSPTNVLAEFSLLHFNDGEVSLKPKDDLSDEQLDRLLVGLGPWNLHAGNPNQWPEHYTEDLRRKELVSAELFLAIDPLVSLSTAVASRTWVWSLVSAGILLLVSVVIPRGFCGYLCPLGTLIDIFDWMFTARVTRFRVPDNGWWVHIKYYLLAGTMVAALGGVLVSGYVAAIPVITRGMLFLGEPTQTMLLRGRHLVPAMNAGHWISITLFLGVLALGFLRPRFWCKYVCPSGAVFSLGNLFRATERKVESTCINCNKCVEICPFDAIKPDFTTRGTDCTFCQTCGGVCPTQAIKFVERWNLVELKIDNDPPTGDTAIGRRGFMSLAAGVAAAAVGGVGAMVATRSFGAKLADPNAYRPVRPPGSVPEAEFLQMCIRCGECFKVCPNNVLQAEGFQQGLEGLWAPLVNADWAGCESSCNACGQVCPTGAIRALPLEEKRVARMGLAIVNESTCLPFAGREACQLCVDECVAAGYDAIEFIGVHTSVDSDGLPMAGSGFLAPVVLADKCVGCGLCQTRCYGINVKEKGLLSSSAIVIEAGEGKEDRLHSGSYLELRRSEEAARQASRHVDQSQQGYFIPDASTSQPPETKEPSPPDAKSPSDDPFGLNPSRP